MGAKRGDRIVVESEAVGQPTREGELLEVIVGSVSVRYRVLWSDGHESIFTPSVGSARFVPAPPSSKRRASTTKAPTKRPATKATGGKRRSS